MEATCSDGDLLDGMAPRVVADGVDDVFGDVGKSFNLY